MDVPGWVSRYVGIPFVDHGRRPEDGFDCWGLCQWVWREHFGIDVPSYTETYISTREEDEIARVLLAELPSTPWRPVARAEARPGDGVLLRVKGQPIHVGVFLGDERFLHADPRCGVVLDRLTSAWWERRLLGLYRYTA